jgi:rare lipoprotein A
MTRGWLGLLVGSALYLLPLSAGAGERPRAPRKQKAVSPLGEGLASYYSSALTGRRTASGERLDPKALTAAHRTLPFGTCLRVVNQGNGRSVQVRVNDRGPFSRGRVVDVSLAAARRLGMVEAGVARVRLYPCAPPPRKEPRQRR